MPDAEASAARERAVADLGDGDAGLLIAAARQAGAIALGFFGRDPQIWTKGDSSPVTAADIAVDHHLAAVLRAARPDYGWLSEETEAVTAEFLRERMFVVDPIDGTRSFIAGLADWTVSLAVVAAGRPRSAVVYAPVPDEMFVAVAGEGAWLDGRRIRAAGRSAVAGATLAAPGFVLERAPAGILRAPRIHSLAYRMANVAAGRIDAAIASSRASHWDLAAADLLVHEAGGVVTDFHGDGIRYDGLDLRHPALLAAGRGLHPALMAAMEPLLAPR